MLEYSKALTLAVIFMLLAGALYLLAPVLSGFTSEGLSLIPFGIIFLALGYLLNRKYRWLAWITFFVALSGGIIAIDAALGMPDIPGWLYGLIALVDWIAALMLFGFLWHAKPATD